MRDEDIATELRAAGLRTARGHAFGAQAVRNVRHSIRLARPSALAPGEAAVRQVAASLGVSEGSVYYWMRCGDLPFRRSDTGLICILSLLKSRRLSDVASRRRRIFAPGNLKSCLLEVQFDGPVEEGCKSVVHRRLKQSGMRWTVRGAASVISLRCQQASGRWEAIWQWARTQTNAA